MVDPPIDLSQFQIEFDTIGGIDFDDLSDEMNFDISVD